MVLPRSLSTLLRASLLAGVLGAAALAPAASAHVSVRPAVVAPNDPVLWTVLVPGEREVGFVEIKLQVPEGVVPFSFEDQPGWKRTAQTGSNGALESITWRGKAAKDGLVALRFLASTPEQPGTITWKSIQTYEDGTTVRWIGDESSESPASITRVEADAPREDAGGEGADAAPAGATAEPTPAPDTTGAAAGPGDAQDDDEDEDERDGLTLGLAIAGLAAGLGALGLTLTRRRSA